MTNWRDPSNEDLGPEYSVNDLEKVSDSWKSELLRSKNLEESKSIEKIVHDQNNFEKKNNKLSSNNSLLKEMLIILLFLIICFNIYVVLKDNQETQEVKKELQEVKKELQEVKKELQEVKKELQKLTNKN